MYKNTFYLRCCFLNCTSCNNNIPDNAAFCPFCGANTAQPKQQSCDVNNTAVDNIQPQQSYNNQQYNQQYAQPYGQQSGYNAYTQTAQQQSYAMPPQANYPQQGQGTYPRSAQQNYSNVPGSQPQSGAPKVPPYQNSKKKMGPGAIIGIVAGGIVGFIILLVILVSLFSIPPEPPRPYNPETGVTEVFDFQISDETDEQGRQLVLDYYTGEVIGYVEDGQVHIPHGDDEIICDTDGNVIYHPDRESEPNNNNPSEEGTTDGGAGDYNPPPAGEGDETKPEKTTGKTNQNNNGKKPENKPGNNNGKDSPVSGGSSSNVSYDVVEFVDNMFGAVKLHETSFINYCETQSYNEVDLVIFGVTGETKLVEDGYNAFSAYMTEDEYNKVKDLFPYDACSIYKKSEIEKKIKQIWGNKLAVEDFLSNDEFVSSKGYVIVEELPGSGDGAEHYWNVFSQEIQGDHIVVKVNMLGYGWYDGSLWDAVNYTDSIANIGAENSPSSYTEAVERGSVDEGQLSYITLYLKNTDDGLKLDYIK